MLFPFPLIYFRFRFISIVHHMAIGFPLDLHVKFTFVKFSTLCPSLQARRISSSGRLSVQVTFSPLLPKTNRK